MTIRACAVIYCYKDRNERCGIMEKPEKINQTIIPLDGDVDHAIVGACIDEFSSRYDFLERVLVGKSIRGRELYCVRLGRRDALPVLYVGTHHGMEHLTSALLLRFINEYCESMRTGGRLYGVGMEYLFSERCIYVLPMLNPDGAELSLHGASRESPLYERLIKMNGGEDFTHWQANERGVDLNHNYSAGFFEYKSVENENGIYGGGPTKYSGEYPESEPETSALCTLIRTVGPELILTLHTQGEEIYYTSGGECPRASRRIGRVISELTGYELAEPEGTAAYGGLTDWFVAEYGKPSFTIECGRGKNPLPPDDFFSIYARLRELFFRAPILV